MSESAEILCRRYKAHSHLRWLFLVCATFLLVIVMAIGLCIGASGMGFRDVISSLFKDTGRGHSIIWMLRLPRIMMAALAGFGLGAAGAVFQVILRNPLASPYTLGVGSAAGFGAVSAILFFGDGFHTLSTASSAFLFSMISAAFILAIAKMKRATSETMILTGIALMFLFSSLTALLQYMGTMEQVSEIVFWFFGSLSKAGWKEIGLSSLMIILPVPVLLRHAWDFNLLSSGDESALALGVNVNQLRMSAVAAASLMAAGGICFTGVIGFVGLVAPHITRMVIGNDHQFLLPASGIVGAVIVVAADTLGRTIWAPQVIPIGIVTSFIGVPFFFYLLMRRSREYW